MITKIDIRDFLAMDRALRERASERRFEAQVEREWREQWEREKDDR